MVTVFARTGKVLKMETLDKTIKFFGEIDAITAMNEIARQLSLAESTHTTSFFSNRKVDKTSGKTIRQIQLLWKEGKDQLTREVVYEWLT